MPHWAAASPRGRPSSTSAIASIRRAAFASRVRAASRRRSAADRSVRVIATAIPASRIHVREKRIIPTSARGITGESTIRALGITSRSILEQLGDEAGLGSHVSSADVPKLPFPDHRHRLIARQRSSRGPEAPEAEPWADQASYAPVVLFHDVIEELALP